MRAAEADRERARVRARARPWRALLYPLVGLLPEEEQERLCDRLGLYALTATLVSGLLESLGLRVALSLFARSGDGGRSILVLTALPGLVLLVLPGLGRAFGAVFLRETAGSAPVALGYDILRALGALRRRHDRSFVPLTRRAFWERLERPDEVEPLPDGTFVFRGLLPHLTWGGARRLFVGQDFWSVTPERPVLRQGRLVYSYRVEPAGEPRNPASRRSPRPPIPTTRRSSRRCAASGTRSTRGSRGSPACCRPTCRSAPSTTAAVPVPRGARPWPRPPAMALLGLYVLSFLPGPPGDPLGPFLGVLAAGLVLDAVLRFRSARQSRYSPSLFRFLLPSDSLRPERLAWHAHRDAEREALAPTGRT